MTGNSRGMLAEIGAATLQKIESYGHYPRVVSVARACRQLINAMDALVIHHNNEAPKLATSEVESDIKR